MKDTTITPDDWQPADVDDLQVETMAGDIRDILVTKFKERNRPWSMLTQQEQHDLANGLETSAKDLVRRVVRLVTATDFQRVVVKVGDLKVAGGDKAGLEAKVTAANITENREVLCELPGRYAILLCVDSEEFMGEREPVKTDPDQPELPTGDGAKLSSQKSQKDSDISDAPEAEDADAPEEPETPTEQGEEGDDLDHDPETGEVRESATSEETPAEEQTNKPRGERDWLVALAKLPAGGTSHVPEGFAAKLIEKGHIAVVHPKRGSNPARYTITPAGRAATDPEA